MAQRFESVAESGGLQATAELATSTQTATAPFEDLVDEIDPRTWQKLTLTAGARWEDNFMQLQVRKRPSTFGAWVVQMDVKSADPGFTASTTTQLSEEINLGQPRWSWLHRHLSSGVLAMLVVAILYSSGLLALSRAWPGALALPWPSATALILVAVVLGIAGALPPVMTRLIPVLVPPADIRYDSSTQSPGSRFLAALIGIVVVPLVIGVLINLVV